MKRYAGGFLYNPDTGEVLLHKRDAKAPVNPDAWAFFGGNSEGEETPHETFLREVHEELGIELDPAAVRPLCDYFNPDFATHRYVFYAESRLPKSAMTLGEGEGFDWVPLKEAFRMKLTKRTHQDLDYFGRHLQGG